MRREHVFRLAALAALTLGIAVPARAQTRLEAVTFDEAVQRAVQNNAAVAQAATSITRAEALLQQARALTRPVVFASFSTATLDHAVKFDGDTTQPQTQATLSATVSAPILAGSRWAGVNQARDQIDVSRLATDEVRRSIAVAAAQAYLGVIAQRRAVDVIQRSLENARTHLDYARTRREGGLGSRLNELRAAQVVAADEARLENVRLALLRAQEALGVIIVAPGPVDAAGEPPLERPEVSDLDAAIAGRPDLQRQIAVQRAAERVVRDSRRDLWPTGSVSFTPQYVAPSGLFQPSKAWRLTFSFTQPIFEGGQRASALRLRQLGVEVAKLGLTDLQIHARAEVRLADASVSSYERALASARLAAGHAAEVLKITTVAFEVGATTNLEVIDAQRSARDAESATVVAEDALRRAKLDLLVALGRFPR